jgi:hypothetical protein
VTRRGDPVRLEANTEAILHGLALSGDDGLSRDELEHVLPEPRRPRRNPQQAVRNALGKLWGKRDLNLPISPRTERVVLPRDSDAFSVDLWDFFRFAEEKRYRKAREMINPRGSLKLPRSERADADLWLTTLDEFERVRSEVLEELEARFSQVSRTGELRKQLLARSLISWAYPQQPIAGLREKVEAVDFPWRLLKPGPPSAVQRSARPSLQEFMADELETAEGAESRRMLIVGEHGRGKTQAAIATFLRLTDHLEGGDADPEARPIIFVDAHSDAIDPDVATDAWLERNLRGADGLARPLVVLAHAEAFFDSVDADVKAVLGWRLFRKCDVLLCCTDRFYSQRFKYSGYPTHVTLLEPWSKRTQDEYAAALYGEGEAEDFASWRDGDPTGLRTELCAVPIHISFLLPLVLTGEPTREKISKRWHLLDQLARERLRAARPSGPIDLHFDELAAVSHRFFLNEREPGEAVGFRARDLEDFLAERDPNDVQARRETILTDTLVTFPRDVSDEERFEHPVWGWFFTAYHLADALVLHTPRESPLLAFAKPFSDEVMDICREILFERMPGHGDRILRSIDEAVAAEPEPQMTAAQIEVARRQLADLREVLGARSAAERT